MEQIESVCKNVKIFWTANLFIGETVLREKGKIVWKSGLVLVDEVFIRIDSLYYIIDALASLILISRMCWTMEHFTTYRSSLSQYRIITTENQGYPIYNGKKVDWMKTT